MNTALIIGLMGFAVSDDLGFAFFAGLILFCAGPTFFVTTYARYRNQGERHYHERETPARMDKLQVYDNYVTRLTEQRSGTIPGANSTEVRGTFVKGGVPETMTSVLGSLLPSELGDQLRKFK
ncbi:MAG: hypothetical protein LBP24_01075 [Coriobacteriales bacterium]|jgi:hypothetical protein|nr:hypothetical protein [Coriobacteriales bacterium]